MSIHLPPKSMETIGLENMQKRLERDQEAEKQTGKWAYERVVIQMFLSPIITHGIHYLLHKRGAHCEQYVTCN